MKALRIAVIPGDGIGPEVVAATMPVVAAAARRSGADLDAAYFDWGGGRFLRLGEAMPPDAPAILAEHDAALFGAVGRPDVPDTELIWSSIISLRQQLHLNVNARPVRTFSGVRGPLRDYDRQTRTVDLLVARENSEGEYSGIGGLSHGGQRAETAVEVAVHTRVGIESVARWAFDAAAQRRGLVTLVTKSNALRHGFALWDSVVAEVAEEFPDVELRTVLVDAMAALMVQRPEDLDVLVCSNLFGDVLSDLAAAVVGGLGMAPSGNVGTETPFGLFEPVHGSAPDIAGRGWANPVACLLSGAMMLEHLGLPGGARAVHEAVADTLADPRHHTPDLGGRATTDQLAAAVLDRVESASAPNSQASHVDAGVGATSALERGTGRDAGRDDPDGARAQEEMPT